MNAQQAENLRVLIRHMESQNPLLGMAAIHECGTPSCAWGHALYIAPLPEKSPRDYSGYNAPFCHHPEKCGPEGRCLREIACND